MCLIQTQLLSRITRTKKEEKQEKSKCESEKQRQEKAKIFNARINGETNITYTCAFKINL